MKKHKKKRITIPLANLSNFFLVSKQTFVQNILKQQWENFLFIYKYRKMVPTNFAGNIHVPNSRFFAPVFEKFENKNRKFFFIKKEEFFNYNYLILAKLGDLIGNTHIVKNGIRTLIKINSNYWELEKHFQIHFSKKSILFYWISYLLIEHVSQFIKLTNSFLSNITPFFSKENKLEIQDTGTFLFFTCEDFHILKWYQKKICKWFYHILQKRKEIQFNQNHKFSFENHQPLPLPPRIPNGRRAMGGTRLFSLKENQRICAQKETKNTNQKIEPSHSPEIPLVGPYGLEDKKISHLSKLRYLQLIKNILCSNKIRPQIELIQKLNDSFRNWDTLILNSLTKRNSLKLNLILYQLLWRWGILRHRTKRAKWMKHQYWFQKKQGAIAFSFFSLQDENKGVRAK